ncbi:MAG: DUF5686 family protein [bacterium]
MVSLLNWQKKILLIAIAILVCGSAYAVDIVVVGQVLSATDSHPLEAANVWFKDTEIGTTTNDQGFFMLRSNTPQKAVCVSVIGYNQRTIPLEYGSDQMIEVYLREQSFIIDEIIAMPDQSEARELLTKVRQNRFFNDAENIRGIATDIETTTTLNLNNVKSKLMQRRLFNDLKSGAVAINDTNYSLPVYIDQTTVNKKIGEYYTDSEEVDHQQNALNLLQPEQWEQLIAAYTPNINFYKSYSTIMGANFMSPVAKSAQLYYRLFLSDSISTDSGKEYEIRFSPKVNVGSLYRGSMWIDSASYAITKVDTRVIYDNNVPFLGSLTHNYNTQKVNDIFYPEKIENLLGVQINIVPDTKSQFFGAIVGERTAFKNTSFISDTISYVDQTQYVAVPIDSRLEQQWHGIDSINQTKIQKFAAWAVDLYLFQYLKLGMIDFGPILNIFHYNNFEGASPRLTLRTNEQFAKKFSVGGYYGYGFKDKEHKYGGEMQWRFGENYRNTIKLTYDHRVDRYGYDDLYIYDENRYYDIDHVINSIDDMLFYKDLDRAAMLKLALHSTINARYQYDVKGFKLTTDLLHKRTYSNDMIPYIHNGTQVEYIDQNALKFDFRFSWDQRDVSGFFQKYYLGTKYPVIHLLVETGYGVINSEAYPYGKFGLYMRQSVPLGFGKLHWAMQANYIMGDVAFPQLIFSRGKRSSYCNSTDFMLMDQMEFLSDKYISANIRYQTRGFIFGYIPVVNKLGIREDLIFNIGYGSLSDFHKNVLTIPTSVYSWDNMPYMEAGFGFSNILKMLDIEFMWRLTHRDHANAQLFGVKWCLPMSF